MNTLVRDTLVEIGSNLGALHSIAEPSCALAIYRRRQPSDLIRDLNNLALDEIDDLALEIDVDTVPRQLLKGAGYPDYLAARLSTDLGELMRAYAAITGQARLTVRLEVVDTDACRRFHADYVPLRLLCTYVGPGTQWHRCDRPDEVEQLRTGDVAIFKGLDALDPPALLHRSPPIACTGERRLLLVLDRVRGPVRS